MYTIVQTVLIDETGDSYYRMRWPARRLCLQDSELRVLSVDARSSDRFKLGEAADLLVLYQCSDFDWLPVIAARRKLGKKTLVEYNDNFYDPPWASPVAMQWKSPLLWQIYEIFMQEADGIMVTGKGLEQLFKQHTDRPVHILENYIHLDLEPFSSVFESPANEIRIGWAGSLGHVPDLLAIAPLFNEIIERYRNVKIMVMGNDSLPELLKLPSDRFVFRGWGSMQQYYEFIKQLHIGLVPILDTPYNNCRSDIKAVELAAWGVLPIVSKAPPYHDFLAKTGAPAFTSLHDLSLLVESYLQDPSKIAVDAERCYRYVESERQDRLRSERLELYRSYLPAAKSSFEWKQGPGYHELASDLVSQSRTSLAFDAYRKAVARGLKDDALNLLRTELNYNPWNIDVALVLLAALAASGSGECLNLMDEYIARFPRDLRLAILKAWYRSTKELGTEDWRRVIEAMAEIDPYSRQIFYPDLERRFLPLIKSNRDIYQFALELALVLDDFAALRFEVAQTALAIGDLTNAELYFSQLCDQRRLVSSSSAMLSQIQANYLPCMQQSVQARIAGKFGKD
ncbi:MAG: hypothetical protein J5J00_08280 [Deltaproteobacteria bacterium]|nr:hypothetical protein [Deltaproteobacteria bacterium]